MNPISRGVRNAFRNVIRTLSIVIILGLSIGLSLTMLVANKAVDNKIQTVKSSIGNTISVSAAGVQGFQGGGDPLSEITVNKLSTLSNVTSVNKTVSDQLRNNDGTTRDGTATTANTSLTTALEFGSLGRRFDSSSSSSSLSTTSTDANASADTPSGGPIGGGPGISAYGTTDPTRLNGSAITLSSGTTIDGATDKNVALVGTTLAEKNNLKVGSTFTVYGETITVAGIFDSDTTFSNNSVILSLPTLQRLSDQSGELTSATVNVNSVTNIDSVTTAVKSTMGDSADVTNSKDTVSTVLEPLNSVKSISTFSLIGATAAGAVIILLTMIMIVRERKKEIGVVKAIGGSNMRIVSEFMVESLTLAILGAVIGLIIGVTAGQPVTKLLVNNSTSSSTSQTVQTPGIPPSSSGSPTAQTRPTSGFARRFENNAALQGISNIKAQIGLSILAYGFGAAVLIAILGSGFSAGLIAKVRPSNVMRAD